MHAAGLARRAVRFFRPRALQRFFHRHRDRGLRRPAVHPGPVRHRGRAGARAAGRLPGARDCRPQRHRPGTQDRSRPAFRLGALRQAGGRGAGHVALPVPWLGWSGDESLTSFPIPVRPAPAQMPYLRVGLSQRRNNQKNFCEMCSCERSGENPCEY
ncbi:hypothetical protein CNECB9_5080021 [Cupriavidus necator]|uniref:Uncharacterized protein n=1 Tax=Cupriavidus necator TaxID=106590 RepID=A0A1K0IND1_CUPNE|nr:hypothetical protein CNECB9_5080021 [Cupriavidus necator]